MCIQCNSTVEVRRFSLTLTACASWCCWLHSHAFYSKRTVHITLIHHWVTALCLCAVRACSCISYANPASASRQDISLAIQVSQKGKWRQRIKSADSSAPAVPRSVSIRRLRGIHAVSDYHEDDGTHCVTYYSCILAVAPEKATGSQPTANGLLLCLRFENEADLFLWVATLKEASALPTSAPSKCVVKMCESVCMRVQSIMASPCMWLW